MRLRSLRAEALVRRRAATAALFLAAALTGATAGRAPSSSTALDLAALAWDAGDFVAALSTYLQILDSAEPGDALETIALQTGELFATHELTEDGDAPEFSPDGGHIIYETGYLPERTTRLLKGDGSPKPLAELPGFRAAFSPNGSHLAYLKVIPTPTLLEALAAAINAPQNERTRRTADFNAAVARESRLTVRDVTSGRETEIRTGDLQKTALAFGAGGTMLLTVPTGPGTSQIYLVAADREPVALTTGPGDKPLGDTNADGTATLFTIRAGGGRGRGSAVPAPGRGSDDVDVTPESGREGSGAPQTGATFGVVLLPEGRVVTTPGTAPSFSADGKTVTYIRRQTRDYQVVVAPAHNPAQATVVRSGAERADAPALSPDGSRVAYQLMPKEDWEIYTASRDGKDETRVTREIQHDLLPRFLTGDLLIAMIGEARHRRSHLYDLKTLKRTRLFHNNTVRTIAPEYAWDASPDGARLLVQAERDGNTVSPERGVYYMDLTRRVSRDALRARLRANLESEVALRAKAQKLYAPIANEVRSVTSNASVARVFAHEKALFDFDSKHVTRPGNKRAAAYLFDSYTSFGYTPEYQTFEYRTRNGAQTGQTSNVLATLKGTVNPELVYVVSSHYDSVAAGPGADDDTTGTAALLETARIMAKHPQPATIVFASFTGEEAGLLGSREFVRQAIAKHVRIVGALNNDMVGWANDHRLDNTIRYSNAGIRDIQHAAAMQFSSMITYDALYFKSTDAAAYYEAYGDIVGGIGSYPVLGNPHYHQSHDLLDTINHQLVTEVAKTTAATLMLLASSPSRLTDLKAQRGSNGAVAVSWTSSPEQGVQGYIVAYGPASKPEAQQLRVQKPSATLTNIGPGSVVSVKAVNARGLEGWDWARVVVR
jgi:Peptidase family M28/WD40-like Beta Propeller Repeat